MKLHILNDLHIEFADFTIPATDSDVIILAGDIGVGLSGLDWLKTQRLNKPVIYVPGNHEYYQHDLKLIDTLRDHAPPNVHVLNDNSVEINGVRFLGSTLWTDFALFGETGKIAAIQTARENMTDFSIIANAGKLFTPEDSMTLHRNSRDWLTNRLAEKFRGKTVVVTHHAPSSRSVDPRYAKNLLTAAFASNLEDMLDGSRVTLWVHGHLHGAFDYEISGTRVLCNPRGYVPFEITKEFVPDLVVEI
jgi:Icc-related predicted phosphoesterase